MYTLDQETYLIVGNSILKFTAKIWQTELALEGLYTKIFPLHYQNSQNLADVKVLQKIADIFFTLTVSSVSNCS